MRKWTLATAALMCVLALVVGAHQVGRIRGREGAIAVEGRYQFWFATLLKSLRVLDAIEKNELSQLRGESEGDLMTSLESINEVIDRMDQGSSDYVTFWKVLDGVEEWVNEHPPALQRQVERTSELIGELREKGPATKH